MHANYRVSLIGLPIGVAVADGAVADNHYKVDLHVRLTGLAALVSNLQHGAGIVRRLSGRRHPARRLRHHRLQFQETRTLRMALNAGTVRQVEYSPFWDEPQVPNACN